MSPAAAPQGRGKRGSGARTSPATKQGRAAEPPPALRAVRILREGFPAFDGTGAARRGGRWNSPGYPVIYAAETYSLAVLENLVHFNLGELPPKLVYITIEIGADVPREVLDPKDLPGWNRALPNPVSARYGDRWRAEGRSAVLLVPSMLSPSERNVVIHPGHPDTPRLVIGRPRRVTLDARLLQAVSASRS